MKTTQLPHFISQAQAIINQHESEVAALDQAIGDGDHVINLQRGLTALVEQSDSLTTLSWQAALQKIGMTLMSTMGGASGSLYGTLFIRMAKFAPTEGDLSAAELATAFAEGIEAMKQRGKADLGEKTMLDTLIPTAAAMQAYVDSPNVETLTAIGTTAAAGMESTLELIATKGRASFLGERSRGHIDAGARSSQLMICAMVDDLV